MKNVMMKMAMTAFAVLAIAACSKDKKNNAAVPPANGLCTIDANGTCVGQAAFVGGGQWRGRLQVGSPQSELLRQFMIENNLCGNYGYCEIGSLTLQTTIRVNGGTLGSLIIRPGFGNGWSNRRLSRTVSATSANSAVGFNLVTVNPYPYQTMIYPPQPNPPYSPIQLNSVFVSPQGELIQVTLYYKGLVLATGQLHGHRYHVNTYGGVY